MLKRQRHKQPIRRGFQANMTKTTVSSQGVVFGLLMIYMTFSYTSLLLHEPYATTAFVEDGYFENTGFLGLFIGAILFFIAAYRSRKPEHRENNPLLKQISYIVLAMILAFGAGEEISWGQRIFNIETPELLQKDNVQDEINIHNLEVVEELPVTPDTLFTIFVMTFMLLIPVAASRFSSFGRFVNRLMPVPHWGFGLLFLANFALAKLAKVLFVSSYRGETIAFVQAVQEVKESNYELLCLFVAGYIAFITLKPTRRIPAA
jgi:hypothetical protein